MYIYVCMYVCMYVCVYIYKEREREKGKKIMKSRTCVGSKPQKPMVSCKCVCKNLDAPEATRNSRVQLVSTVPICASSTHWCLEMQK